MNFEKLNLINKTTFNLKSQMLKQILLISDIQTAKESFDTNTCSVDGIRCPS